MLFRRLITIILLFAILPFLQNSLAQAAAPDVFVQQIKLTGNDTVANDYFGTLISLSGTTAVIGAYGKNSQTGAAYVFTFTGGVWSQQAKLTADDGAVGDKFGTAVSADGDTVVIGAYAKGGNTGAAYVFVRNGTTWTQQQKITGSDTITSDYFGTSVAINSNTIVIGAPGKSLGTGAAYVFTRSGSVWSQQQKLTATGGTFTNGFGIEVALSGDVTIITAPGKSSNTGAAYIFTRSGVTWTEQDPPLTASDGAAGDYFGTSAALDGTTAVIGAYRANNFIGAAYVYVNNGGTWGQQQKLTANDSTGHDEFGFPVSISGDTLIAGASENNLLGAVYIFRRSGSTWTQQQKLIGNDTVSGNEFGVSAALDGSNAVVGDWFHNSNAGAAYVFTLGTGAPVITSPNHATFKVGSVNSFTVTANGLPAPTFSATGLPTWATLNATTGVLSGIPPSIIGSPFAITITASNGVLPNATQNFTLTVGAGTADTVGIFRPSASTFYLRNANTTGPADISTAFGTATDLPVVGDWNGDGIDTVGFYRPSTGQFFLRDSNSAGAPTVYSFVLGAPGDLPMVGDWNSNGKDGVGVFRPSNGLIYLKNNLTTGFADFQMVLGVPGDVPVAGDWNGDGKDSPGVYRPSLTKFFLSNQVCNCSVFADYSAALGIAGDTPFAGDWNGDGITGIGVFRPSNGLIYLKNTPTSGFADLSLVYGVPNDKPIAGHWATSATIPSSTANPITPKIAPTFVP
ncbi:MAG: putative Ig domain-containing protein [Chloroflexota bacterium]